MMLARTFKLVTIAAALLLGVPQWSWAEVGPAGRLAAEALGETPDDTAAEGKVAAAMSILELLSRGGWLMVPIVAVSVVVVAIGVERAIGLRRSAILPTPLAAALTEMAHRESYDPRAAAEVCRQHPSAAARVAQTVWRAIGRPTSELERAVSDACQREADRLYTNVRTLNLASTITPLLGLLGTVWGMIQAFFATANMPIGSNKGQALAEGIYVALVTTFAGLSVAIPAAVLAHLFETRILRSLRDVEQLLGTLLPQVARHDAKLRIDQSHDGPSKMTRPLPTARRESKAS